MESQLNEAGFVHPYDPNKYARPSVAADAVVFRYFDNRLQVLLIQRKNHPFRGHWVFPGGFIDVYEDPNEAVRRELREETGFDVDDMSLLGVFGRPDRDPRYHVISIAYLGIARSPGQVLRADDDAMNAAWFPARKTPPLGFDHEDILDEALTRLKREIVRPSVAARFFERKFTGAELLSLYQQILAKKLDSARFLRGLRPVCLERPTLSRTIRFDRVALRRFESALGAWWV